MDRRTSGDDNWQFTGDFYSKMWECLVLVSTRNVRLWNVRYWENYKCEIFLTCARRTDGQKCTIKTSFSDDSSSLLSGAALTTCFGKTAPFCMFWTKKKPQHTFHSSVIITSITSSTAASICDAMYQKKLSRAKNSTVTDCSRNQNDLRVTVSYRQKIVFYAALLLP